MVVPVKQTTLPDHYTDEVRQARFQTIKARCAVDDNGCWNLKGSPNDSGYLQVSVGEKRWMAHRLMYALRYGSLPEKLYVCHRCDNRRCVNPDHMFLGDHLTNQRDMHAKGRGPQKQKTHCKQGHPYDDENTWTDSRNFRHCRKCQLMRLRLKAGWTREQAESTPVVPHGHRPINAKWPRERQLTEG